jgi:hypothetical protein
MFSRFFGTILLFLWQTLSYSVLDSGRTRKYFFQSSQKSQHNENQQNDLSLSLHDITEVTFVSSNQKKIREVNMILGSQFPWKLITHSVDLVEPQATPIEVSRSKCRQAAELCKGPVIVEDTSLCFNALNGLPGPYIKWFYEAVGNEGLIRMLHGFEDRSGKTINIITYNCYYCCNYYYYYWNSLCTMCLILHDGYQSSGFNLCRFNRRFYHYSIAFYSSNQSRIWLGSYISTHWI